MLVQQKLIKLDQIDNHLSNLSKSVSIIDSRVSSLENSVQENSKKLTDLEASRAYDSKTCEDIRKSQINLERERREGEKKISKVSDNIESLKRRNEELAEEIIDLQGRSMRDNLIFFGFEECRTFDERMNENCIDKILSFCEKELNLENVRNSVKLERAHRI